MDILGMIGKAADLFDEATDIYNQVSPSIASIAGDRPTELASARARLAQSMNRAKAAHDSLDAAIAERLDKKTWPEAEG